VAYGPLAVALENYVSGRPNAERSGLAERYPALVPVVPSLGADKRLPPIPDRPATGQRDLLAALVRLLNDLADSRPVLLVLGDLHDVHVTSLDLLQYLAHLAVQRRWLILGTIRDEALAGDGRLRRMIEATTHERLCLRLEVHRLGRRDSDDLVRVLLPGGGVGDALLEHIYERSLGNPLFTQELVLEMSECGEVVLADGSWRRPFSHSARVPARVRALVATRLTSIEQSTRRVIALAAVASGTEISLSDLRSGAAALQPPVSDAALFDALDRALEIRMLEERNGAYAFRHPLVRLAIYEDLSAHRRDQLRDALARSKSERSR
jgi:predicted ATPase